MYRLHIVTVGSMKKGPLAELVSHYQKLLRPFARVDVTETKEVRRVSKDAFSVLLTEHGKEYFTGDFAEKIASWSEQQTQTIEFVVAGPFGVDKTIEKNFDATLSLSKFTFPHDVATMVLYEQLYRAMTILAGKTYHY
ncbi:23S rRNA (pseudouridine(1915)-N(3))-methyltransferase RlmH [bacterium]|nr:23S rRNA (pseudouridine(1915)-N(3))-methyltransferase RlmH [bacterium]